MTGLSQLMRQRWLAPLIALVALYLLFVALSPDTFARPENLTTMARQTVVVGIAVAGMTLIIISGGIDLSVGSTVALTTVVIARALNAGMSPWSAALLGIVVASVAGAAMGALVAYARITPFVVTLGAMTILRGAAKGVANEQKIDADPQGLDTLMGVLPPDQAWMLFPPGVWLMIVILLLAGATLRYTRFGRHVFAVGSSERTARLCGVQVEWVKLGVYTLAAALAGVAGVLEFATLTVGDPTDSLGLELEVIAAAVIGGASLNGGEGSVLGAAVGAFLMIVIQTGATHLGLPNWVEEVVAGVIIVVAVGLDRLRQRSA
jgi:ribose transport system permease protein